MDLKINNKVIINPRAFTIIASILIVILVCLLCSLPIFLHWFGYLVWMPFTGLQDKDLWDVAELLIIPLVLAGIVTILGYLERNSEREIAKDNQREIAFQSYFDIMTNLLLHEDLKNTSDRNDVRDIAQVKTETTLNKLNTERKVKIIKFLSDVGLINCENNSKPIINLNNVDLENADLCDFNLKGARMKNINLKGAQLRRVNLEGANLEIANLTSVDFLHANLKNSNMNNSDLVDANLISASLMNSSLINADLEGAKLERCNLIESILWEANLSRTSLSNALFKKASYDTKTIWPSDFDPEAVGAINVDEVEKKS